MKLLAPAQDGVTESDPRTCQGEMQVEWLPVFSVLFSYGDIYVRPCVLHVACSLPCLSVCTQFVQQACSLISPCQIFFFHYYSLEIFGFHDVVLISFVSKGRHIPESFYYIISLFCFVLFFVQALITCFWLFCCLSIFNAMIYCLN